MDKEMFEILLNAIVDVKTEVNGVKGELNTVKTELDALKNQVTSMEYKLTNKINALFDGQEVMKDDIRRLEKNVNRLIFSDEDKEIRIRALMNNRI